MLSTNVLFFDQELGKINSKHKFARVLCLTVGAGHEFKQVDAMSLKLYFTVCIIL